MIVLLSIDQNTKRMISLTVEVRGFQPISRINVPSSRNKTNLGSYVVWLEYIRTFEKSFFLNQFFKNFKGVFDIE